MGNYVSCISTSSGSTARVVDWEGNLRHLEIPATAADLMLEAPGHLVSRAEDIRRTRRFQGMRADEELRHGGVYLLFPADRACSRAPDRQMAVVDAVLLDGKGRRQKKEEKKRAGRGSGKVFPSVAVGEEKRGKGKGRGGGEYVVGFPVMGYPGCRLSGSRQWKPVLDTIQESS